MEYLLSLIIMVCGTLSIAHSLNEQKNRRQKIIGLNGNHYVTYIERHPYHVRVVVRKYQRTFLWYNVYTEEKEYQFSEDYRNEDRYYRLKAIRLYQELN